MIAFDRATQRAARAAAPLPPRRTLLLQCRGLVLAKPVAAPMDLLPFPSALAEGFAVLASDLAGASPLFPVSLRLARAAADRPVRGPVRPGRQPVRAGLAVPVRAGEALPSGADAVVPTEQARPGGDGRLEIFEPVEPGALLLPAGSELRRGDVGLDAGRRLGAAEMGLLSRLGVTSVSVHPPPRIGATFVGGDRVLPGVQLGPGRRYDASTAIVSALAAGAGAAAASLGELPADPENLLQAVRRHARSLDLLVVSGGVGPEHPNLLRDTVGWLEGEMIFDRVRVTPGGETLCARIGGCLLFGIPADALGALAAMRFFVLPAVVRAMGRSPATAVPGAEQARLAAPLPPSATSDGLELVPGELRWRAAGESGLSVTPRAAAADCFILVPRGGRAPRQGERVSIARIEAH